jgi:hypothetical protein
VGTAKETNWGTITNFLTIAAVILSIGMNYQKFQENAQAVASHSQALQRIEHYLGSKDANYWRETNQNGDAQK